MALSSIKRLHPETIHTYTPESTMSVALSSKRVSFRSGIGFRGGVVRRGGGGRGYGFEMDDANVNFSRYTFQTNWEQKGGGGGGGEEEENI